jgi:conjugal transfer/type IV secretion protein DotA/TraY
MFFSALRRAHLGLVIAPGILLMVLAGVAGSAIAQTPGELAGLMSATPEGDWSMKLWRYVLGDFADNPFSPGGPNTLLGSMLVIFNTAIFTVGFAWALYGVVSGVVQTAHEGEVLGRRISSVWYPIRTIIGIVGMVPIFKGFTLFQAIMMLLTAVGIGIGNSLWTAGINSTSDMQALVNQNNFTPSSQSDVRKAVQSVFISAVCVAAQRDAEQQHNPPLPTSQLVGAQSYENRSAQEGGYRFGSMDDPLKCGSVSVQANARSESSMLAFRAGGVDYAAIERSATNAYVQGMGTLVTSTMQVANQWYTARRQALDSDASPPAFPKDVLDAIADGFIANTRAAITQYNVDGGALRASVRQNMASLGWFGGGDRYSTFAEANAAIADAAKGPTMKASGPTGDIESTSQAALTAAQKAMSAAYEAERPQSGDGTRAILDSAIRDHCSGSTAINSVVGTATGNCSLGQGIVSAAIRASAIGSGGGGNSGALSLDSTGLVNPIVMSKNMGDYLMGFSATVLVTGWAADLIGWAATKFTAVGRVAGAASELPGVKSVADKVSGSESGFFSILKLAAILLMVCGAFLSIYLPLVPFITWIGAILAYAASVIEGLVGASLHAMAHLDVDGDGMGQRTGHGYLFLVNVLARPALLVIGFFVASALMIVVGTLQAHLFLPAIANVQGNSITGIFSIAAFLLIFAVMNVTLITASFGLIYVITDQVIGFVGGAINSTLGRDTEDKVHGVFMLAARFGPNAISQVGGLKEKLASGKAANKAGRIGGGREAGGASG